MTEQKLREIADRTEQAKRGDMWASATLVSGDVQELIFEVRSLRQRLAFYAELHDPTELAS